MNGTPSARVISLSSPAVSKASWRDSTTHGPAIRNIGRSRPTSKPHSFMIGSGDVLKTLFGRGAGRLVMRGVERSLHESFEERVPGTRRGSEFGMELAGDEPRMIAELDHLAQTFAA